MSRGGINNKGVKTMTVAKIIKYIDEKLNNKSTVIEDYHDTLIYIKYMLDELDNERLKGHWEYIPEKNTPWAVKYFRCSNCLNRISVHGKDNGFGYDYDVKEKHCPHCGAEMESYQKKE